MRVEKKRVVKESMYGGNGGVIIDNIIHGELLKNKCEMFAKVTVHPGCSLGYHEHHGESETYHIISGTGVYMDDGVKFQVEAGDTVVCKDGCGHAMENHSDNDLVFIALILKE